MPGAELGVYQARPKGVSSTVYAQSKRGCANMSPVTKRGPSAPTGTSVAGGSRSNIAHRCGHVVDTIASALSLYDAIRESAKEMLEEFSTVQTVRGEAKLHCMAVASIYLACMVAGNARGKRELSLASGVTPSDINEHAKIMREALRKCNSKYKKALAQNAVNSADFLDRYLDELRSAASAGRACEEGKSFGQALAAKDREVWREANRMSRYIHENCLLEGKNPGSVAGCAIMYALQKAGIELEPLVREMVSAACLMSTQTLAKNFAEIQPHIAIHPVV